MKPGAHLNRAVQLPTPLGQVWFAGTKETICRAASGFVSAGHGNGGESCLAACNSCRWGGSVVRADKEERSVCSLKSPFFVFLFPHQLPLHLCEVRPMQKELWTQERWVLGASSSCAESQPVLASGVAGHKTDQPP